MKNVTAQLEHIDNVPFAMLFMEVPEIDDRLSRADATLTTTYSTSCGVNNDSPDDGTGTKKDD